MNRSLPALIFITRNLPFSAILLLFSFLYTLMLSMPVYSAETNPVPAVGTRAFHLISSSSTFQLGKSFMENCNVTLIGAPFTMTFPGGLVFRNGILYTWNQTSPFQFYSLDTVTGVNTYITNISGVPMPYLTGMCWDGTTMYAVCTNLSSSQLLNFNIATGVCVPIGAPSSICPGAVCLFGRMFSQSSLFSIDIVSDNFYKWNKNTGNATLLGPVGFNANIGMGASFDGNTCYINANNQLLRWDTTGSNTVLCTYSSNVIGIACVPSPPPNPYNPSICRNGLNVVVPNATPLYTRDTIRMIGNNLCSLTDINVKIDTFIHDWDSDMAFLLTHNGGNFIELIMHRGGSGDNFIGTILDDSATIPIANGNAPFTGSFRPEQPLTIYNGQSPAGSWELWMRVDAGSADGFLHAWCLIFLFTCPTGGIQTVEVPITYIVEQNYPNPFNPVTTIKYGLPKFGKTSLVVYDILGKVITTLIDNEFKDAGTYEVGWDASNYSSGIYFYTLESGNYKETKKMLMIK